MNLNSSDFKLEPMSWELNIENRFLNSVGVRVGGHPPTNFLHGPKENRIPRELDRKFDIPRISMIHSLSSNFWNIKIALKKLCSSLIPGFNLFILKSWIAKYMRHRKNGEKKALQWNFKHSEIRKIFKISSKSRRS